MSNPTFDVFLSHNSKDKPAIRDLKRHLSTAGLGVWLDEDELRPGIPWQQLLEAGIRDCKSVAVVVGADGLGPWEDEEMQAALRLAVQDKRPVIPVLLPGAPAKPKLPLFLSNRTWVDLRSGLTDQALARLVWGITGKKPGSNAPSLLAAATAPISEVRASALHSLIPPVADFTGREANLDELRQKLKAGGVAITGLRGLGGAGKTELARKLAAELAADYTDAQIELNLKGVDPQPLSAEEVLSSLLRPFHPAAKLPEHAEELAPLLRQTLNDKRVLVLLDNAKDAGQIQPVLPLPPGCLLIVTSRRHFTLPGLAAIGLGIMEPADARALLLKIAPRIGGSAEALAEAGGRLPLALRLAASLLAERPQTAPEDYLHQLLASQQRLQILDQARDDTAGQPSIEASFDLSFRQLPPPDQQRFTLLAVFTASFDRPAAQAVWAASDSDASATLDILVRLSLLEWSEKLQRFELHDLLRDFARAKSNDLATAHRRHAQHFAQVGNQAETLYLKGGENVLRAMALFDRERHHLEAAFDWLNSCHDKDSAALLVALVNAVVSTGDLRFDPRQRIRWLEAEVKATRLAVDRGAECNALGNLGNSHAALGDARKAIEFYEQALVIHREIGDRRGEGNGLGNLGIAYTNLGDARKAIEFHEQALVIAREIGDRRGEGNALGNLGLAYADLGGVREATQFHEQQLVISREIGDRLGEGAGLGNLGIAYANLGDARKAIQFHEQALVIAREIGNRRGEGTDLGNLGVAYGALGDESKAVELFEQALVVDREIGNRRGEGADLWNSALVFDQLKNRTEAISRAEAALKIFETIEEPNAAQVRATLAQWRKGG